VKYHHTDARLCLAAQQESPVNCASSNHCGVTLRSWACSPVTLNWKLSSETCDNVQQTRTCVYLFALSAKLQNGKNVCMHFYVTLSKFSLKIMIWNRTYFSIVTTQRAKNPVLLWSVVTFLIFWEQKHFFKHGMNPYQAPGIEDPGIDRNDFMNAPILNQVSHVPNVHILWPRLAETWHQRVAKEIVPLYKHMPTSSDWALRFRVRLHANG